MEKKPLIKRQVAKLMLDHKLVGVLRGAGKDWEVECPNEEAKDAFQKVIFTGGFKTGYGSWVLRPSYKVDELDFNNPASRAHY